jgi:hypothetical protein
VFGTFTYEPEPDGAVFGPHHFYLGVIVILLVCWMVYDSESDTGPWIVAGVTLLAVFAFSLTWPYYPVVGALGVLVLLGIATASALMRPFWWRSGLLARSSLFVGLFVAWDDVLSHALGWRTPLDRVWAEHLHPYASDPYVPSDFRLPPDLQFASDLQLPTDVDFSSDLHLPSNLRLFTDHSIAELERLLADGEALVLQQVADALAVVAL